MRVLLRAAAHYRVQKPEEVMTLAGVWRADSVTGSPATSFTDLSGNSRTLTSTGVTLTTTLPPWPNGGLPALTNGGHKAAAATAAPWKALSDGSGAHLWAVVRPLANSAQDTLVATWAASSTEVGFELWHDSTFQRWGISLVNGDGLGSAHDLATWQNSALNGVPGLVEVVIRTASEPDTAIYLNGQLAASANLGFKAQDGASRGLSSANPSQPLTIGALAGGLDPFYGEWTEVGAKSAVMTTTERAALYAWVSDRYGTGIRGSYPAQVIFDGNSIVDETWRSYGVFPHDIPAALHSEVYPVNQGVNGSDLGEMTTRFPLHIAPRYDAARPANIYVPYEFTNDLTVEDKATSYVKYVALCQSARALGFKVVAMPMLPVNRSGIAQTDFDYVNAQIVATWRTFAHAISRHDQDATIGPWSARLNTTLYPDGIHPSATALAYLNPYVVTAINSVLP